MSPAKSKRVLLIQGSSGFGGSKGNLLDVVEALQQTVYQPLIVCPSKGWLTEQLEQMKIPYLLLPFYAWRKWLERPRVALSIRTQWLRALIAWRLDLVHSNEFWWAPHAVLLARHLRIPAIVHLRDGHHTLKKALQYKLDQANAIIAVSTELRRRFATNQNLFSKTLVLLDGFRAPEFACDRLISRRLLGIEDEEFVIGNAGTISERKNQRLLLTAVAQLKRHGRIAPFKVLFAGNADADYMRLLKRDIQQLGLQREVRFLGLVKDMTAFYSAIDALVHCAVREGLPRVIPEAMLARKPVIATVAEGVRDAIPGREFGVVVATNDQIALAGEIERLSQNANRRTEMAQRAYERACLLFGLKAHSRHLTRLYDQLIDGASIATNPGTWQPSE